MAAYETTPGGASMLVDGRKRAPKRSSAIPPEIAVLCDGTIAFQRALVKPAGGALAALFLSQALYWTKRVEDPHGWFWKTQEEWEEEIGLTRYEQETARKRLVERGILEERRAGLPAKLFFRVDVDALACLMRECASADKNVGSPHTGKGDHPNQEGGNSTSIHDHAESTSGNTHIDHGQSEFRDELDLELTAEEAPPKMLGAYTEAQAEILWAHFLNIYPYRDGNRRVKDGKARFFKLLEDGVSGQSMIEGVVLYARYVDLSVDDSRFVMQIPSFLNGRIWEEYLQERETEPESQEARIHAATMRGIYGPNWQPCQV